MIVLDASAAIELLLGTTLGQRVAERIADPEVALHAPQLLDLEVAQALRRYAAAGVIDAERGRRVLDDLRQLGVTRWDHEPLLPRVWTLRHNFTAYDAAYAALAEALGAVLLTADRRLATAPGLAAPVEIVV